ncbi:TetR/AcrR family transcriptional regulator [Vibrio kanaloae]|uniref:TetR/AcrR family transcriptional regulator n=1 Tax=Vibrio kanaloae TaxID=170673 RepID=A0A4U1Z387_9VIBR|nr:TetR/AcrR family transcriptional regulator [Vibrio kanaloae]TKF28655.1 TetR/AcrR family transcriptional regulator [Vibrio kanaloae]
MARITQLQKIENQKKYNNIVLQLFLSEGHEALTYARIAQETGVSLTTLQGYFPSTRAIRAVLHKHVLSVMMAPLDFSTKSAFYDSWKAALNDKPFKNAIKLMFFHASQNPASEELNLQVNGVFRHKMMESFGEDTQQIIEIVLGRSLLQLTNLRAP